MLRQARAHPEPAAVLDGWRGWGLALESRPRLIGALPGGSANRCFLVEAKGERLVLRIGAADAAPYGVDRDAESLAITAAHGAGLAPALRWREPEQDLALFDFVEGARLTAATIDAASLGMLLDALAQIHALDAGLPMRDYAAYYTDCFRRAGAGSRLPGEIAKRLARLAGESPAGLVHHDPGPGNVLFGNRGALMIDWEYAAAGYAAFDYAAVVVDWQAPVADVAAASGLSPALLADACALYRDLCGWWRRGIGRSGATAH